MDDDSKTLKEIDEEIKKGNYLRAETISRTLGCSTQELKALRIKAFKQFIMEFRNHQGASELAKQYQFTKEDINQIIDEIIKEAEEKKILEKRQFDTNTMKYLSLKEWLETYFKK
jgi:alcohol dehydrogenase class IV